MIRNSLPVPPETPRMKTLLPFLLLGLVAGYYVARIKLQDQPGHWSAFWLNNSSVGKVGNDGRDGTEIAIVDTVTPCR
jgi:hypothetical protein